MASSRPFSSLSDRVARSAASLRWACHAMATNTAAISGTSVSSAGGSEPRHTSRPMPAAVVSMTAPSTHMVGAARHGWKP